MKMLIALLSASLLTSVSACSLDRLTGTKPKANAPSCTTPPFHVIPDSSYAEYVDGKLVVYTRLRLICGEEAKQWEREHPTDRVPG